MNSRPTTTDRAGVEPRRAIDIVNASLKRRYAAERRFRLAGAGAMVMGLGFVLMLFVSIVSQGYTAFAQTYIQLPVAFDPRVVDPDGDLVRDHAQGELTRAEIDQRLLGVNFMALSRDALKREFPGVSGRTDTRALNSLLSPGAPLQLRELLARDPSLVGSERPVWLLADDDVDMFMKGRSTPVRRLDVGGTATISAADGSPLAGDPPASGAAVRVQSTSADFAPLLFEVRALLGRQADRAKREISRVERALAENAAEQERLVEDLADARAIDRPDAQQADPVALLEAQLKAVDVRRTDLEGQLRAQTERLGALRARIADDDGDEELTEDMPSFLVQVNGGLVKATSVTGSQINGTVFLPPDSLEPAEPDGWRIVELTLPETDRRLKDRQVAWILQLEQAGQIKKRFNTNFFTNGTSREPELAGIAGALMGSFYTLVLTLLFSFPIGVGAAVYLEEFAPKNRITDLIEVNINNLAAVPSIVFGLLGLAVFINFFGIPRSTPLIGGDGADADDLADHHHRQPRGAEIGAAVDPRGGARRRRIAVADADPSRTAAGPARHADRHHHRHGAGPGRDRATADDRHDRVHRRHPRRLHRPGHGAAGADLLMGGQPGARLRRAHLGGDHGPARVPDPDEPGRRAAAPPLRAALVGPA